MFHYPYLIIGGGMTAAAALSGIRKVDAQGTIGLISAEHHPPYNRPPLSKGLWKGKPLEKIWRRVDLPGVELFLGRTVTALDPQAKQVIDNQGIKYSYGKLLLATGGMPRRFPFGGENITYFRNLDDYLRLKELTAVKHRFAVIGGGFIGSEIAAALAMNGQQVVMLFPEEGIGSLAFPPDLAHFLKQYYLDKGVEVISGVKVTDLELQDVQIILKTDTKPEVVVDGVIAGIGIQPNTDLAKAASLAVDNGIVVDEYLRTSHPDIYAAGDVARFYSPQLGKHMRVEHEDNANSMGELAGRNMASASPEPYHHLPYFYSDLFDLGYEAVGELNPRLDTFSDWSEPYQKGVIYYLDGGRVRGVLLWNVWDQVEAARKLIAENGPFSPTDLKGRLPV